MIFSTDCSKKNYSNFCSLFFCSRFEFHVDILACSKGSKQNTQQNQTVQAKKNIATLIRVHPYLQHRTSGALKLLQPCLADPELGYHSEISSSSAIILCWGLPVIDPIRGNTEGSILVILYAAFGSETQIIVSQQVLRSILTHGYN